MGPLAVDSEPVKRSGLPLTPPDTLSLASSSPSYLFVKPATACEPRKDLPEVRWPTRPDFPISPPMSSYDRLRNPPLTASPTTGSGRMLKQTTTEALTSSTISASASIVPRTTVDDEAFQLAVHRPGQQSNSDQQQQQQQPQQKLPSLSSLFGPPPPLHPSTQPSPPVRQSVETEPRKDESSRTSLTTAPPPTRPLPSYGQPPSTSPTTSSGSPLQQFQREGYEPAKRFDERLPSSDKQQQQQQQQQQQRRQESSPPYRSATSFPLRASPDSRESLYSTARPPSPPFAPLSGSRGPSQDGHDRWSDRREERPQERAQDDAPRQWPDIRSGYVAVGKWSLRHNASQEDYPATYSSSSSQKELPRVQTSSSQSYSQHSPYNNSQRYPNTLNDQPSLANEHEQRRQQQQQQQSQQRLQDQQQPPQYPQPYSNQIAPPPPPPPLAQSHSSYNRNPVQPTPHPASLASPVSMSSLSAAGTPAPTSAAVSEGLPAKDGLGPKIWTGSQFLPRYVRAAEVPGEGLCYFYDDGSHCKAVIDGEAVNAHWGVTKAGKPRKRLAIACVTCREKKIKCDPDYPRCVQCEKFGRVCRFKNAPRGGNNTSPGTPPAEMDMIRRPGDMGMILPPPESPRPIGFSSALLSPRAGLTRPMSPDSVSSGPSKRLRTGYPPAVNGLRSPTGLARASPPLSRSSPASAPTSTPVDLGRPSLLLPPLQWGNSNSNNNSNNNSQYHTNSMPPSVSSPRSFADYRQTHYHSQYAANDRPRSVPTSPLPSSPQQHQQQQQQRQDLPRLLLPPPRSHPDLPHLYGDGMQRQWQSQPDLYV